MVNFVYFSLTIWQNKADILVVGKLTVPNVLQIPFGFYLG